MGFFSDLKEDLSQAVNELMPEEETDESISLDAMLENIDDIKIPEEMQEDSASAETEPVKAEDAEIADDIQNADDAENADDTTESIEAENKAMEELTISEEDSKEEDSEQDSEWDLESMLENALTEEKVQPVEKTEEYKGAAKTMEMNMSREAVDETSVITAGMTITGDVVSEGSLDIIGKVNGNIDIMGKLNITGHIIGNSKAAEIYAEGAKINGEVVSEGAVKIGASTVIVGNITATSAAIAGAVKGDIDVRGPVILDASAIVMGNIKSKSVQINNGAVIEGMCSQCYADVSPTSFFEDYKLETKQDKNK